MQEDGKLIVAAPEQAAKLAAVADEPERVYTLPGLPTNMVYVVDVDRLTALPPFSFRL